MLQPEPNTANSSKQSHSSHRATTLGSLERHFLLSALDLHRPLCRAGSRDLSWPALIAGASEANVLPTLADRVLASAGTEVDADTLETLRDALRETAVYNTRLLAELARCSSILSAAGIEHVTLKGAVLLVQHYPRTSMRHTVDLDVLVDPARFEESITLLRAAGYTDDAYYATTLVGDGRSLAAATPPTRWHAYPPLTSPSGVAVDVHYRVPASFFDNAGGFHGLLERSQPVMVHGVSVHMCSCIDLARHLCEHFAVQHHAHPHDAARLLCDLRAMFPDDPPWRELQIGSFSQRASVSLVKRLYEAVFSDSQAPVSRLLRRMTVADSLLSPLLAELSHLRGHAARFSYNLRNRPAYALRTVIPTRAYMAQQYNLDPRSPWIYPRYVTRLFATPLRPLWRRR